MPVADLLLATCGDTFALVWLETASFMTEAIILYRSAGFTVTQPFADSETATTGMEGVIFMQH